MYLQRTIFLQHIDTNDLTKLLKELNGFEIVEGQQIKVQISTSRVRQHPGMDDPQRCYKYVFFNLTNLIRYNIFIHFFFMPAVRCLSSMVTIHYISRKNK